MLTLKKLGNFDLRINKTGIYFLTKNIAFTFKFNKWFAPYFKKWSEDGSMGIRFANMYFIRF